MFWTKVNRLQTRGTYSIEELFDAIKEERFSAGMPRLVHQGLTQLIVFPAVDADNQVRVCNAAIVSPSNKFYVKRDEQVGAIVDEAAIGVFAGSWDGRSCNASNESNAKLCERLAETTCRELDALGL